MADALLSPSIALPLWGLTAGSTLWAVRRLEAKPDERRIPLMGVMAAFLFSVQMINFSLPGTGSSAHLSGGLLLAILLGPHAGFIVMLSILLLQALLFADGGLLAFGANAFNLGFIPCYLALPLIYRPLERRFSVGAAIPAALFALSLGALGIVLETRLSGISSLKLGSFMALMLPLHLVIGLVEGLLTAAALRGVQELRPDLLQAPKERSLSLRRPLLLLGLLSALIGGGLALYASRAPDALEWSLETLGFEEEPLSPVQERLTLMPDYEIQAGERSSWAGLLGGGLLMGGFLGLGCIFRGRFRS